MRKIWNDKERSETKKVCFKCNKEKSLLEYYRHSQMKDGHLNKCKACAKEDSTTHRDGHLEKIREYDRERSKLPHRTKLNTESTERLRKNFPLKYKAHNLVDRAVKNGKLIKPKICEACNKPGRQIEGHHNDYSKPLDVTWLCSACHKQLHRDMKSI